jgi:hypothetical protein
VEGDDGRSLPRRPLGDGSRFGSIQIWLTGG